MSLVGDELLEEFWRLNEQWTEAAPQYEHISQNEFSYRKHKRQKEEDIAICECKYDVSNPESACGESCLNGLTSTECSPGYCRCGIFCKNQRFQKCEYAKTKLFKTEGRGWGLLADEDIKAGTFIIEYCGEVISWKEARRRSQAYEKQGLKDAFIISLNSSESIDATRKGSLARFINHSCQPNCETRKWHVLGEIRVGIFAKQDIPIGAELTYDYNFEWYGGAKVRCLCGAVSCSGFLGAKSRGFQEDTYLWEDDDDRYSVEKIPLYDSEEDDEPAAKISRILDSNLIDDINGKVEHTPFMNFSVGYENQLVSSAPILRTVDSVPLEGVMMNPLKDEPNESMELYSNGVQQELEQKHALVPLPHPDVGNDGASQNYRIGLRPLLKIKKQRKRNLKVKSKIPMQKQVDAKYVAERLALKEAQDEVLIHEEMKNEARSELSSLYDEIRPAIEQHERDNQDSVATSVAEKWIEASCAKLKAEFDLYSCIIKNVACTPRKVPQLMQSPQVIRDVDNEVKCLGV